MQTKPLPPPKRRRWSRRKLLWTILLPLLLIAYPFVALAQPLTTVQATKAAGELRITTAPSELPWPSYGQAAVGLVGSGVISHHGVQQPLATASVAKVITALVVLQKYPLAINQPGPTITLNAADVAYYNAYVAVGGSIVPVQNGEQLSERQMLAAMLLPSANNMADSLGRWAYGSLPAYSLAANNYLKQQGLSQTQVGSDASGFSPSTTSTASDLVQLGSLAMAQPALAQIVAEPSATIPLAGSVANVNRLLGSDQIVGIKTGNNDQDTGAFLGAANVTVNGHQTTIITAIMGAGSLQQALTDSLPLINAARHNFASTTLVQAGAVLGSYQLPWGGLVQAVASQNLSITTLQGDTAKASLRLESISPDAKAGQVIGSLNAPTSAFNAAQSIPIILKQTPSKPPLSWRLLHLF